MRLKFSDLFDGRGSDALAYSAHCAAWTGREVEIAGYLSQDHPGAGRAMLVEEPGVCPDCSAVPVACMALPGFVAPAGAHAVRVRGRLSFGFAVDDAGNASFLRLEGARVVTGLAA
jgi:hypothetical protein